jgi:lipopolysaccharide transport system ATP-binding protein
MVKMIENDIAIEVENIGKRYRIGLKEQMQDSFLKSVIEVLKSPITNYRKYRSLYRFDDEKANSRDDSTPNSIDIIWALKNISFRVSKGEVIGIIGTNGAGKSTLLKILSRITDPTTGYAEIRGKVSSLLEVGTGFHPELTGRENVYLNGTILGMTKKEVDSKFDDIIEFSGVEKFIDTPVKRYSSGMLVRLAFSVAAHLEPEILIIDEVLAVGDAAFQQKCLGKMENVAKEGRTVLFVSHNMAAVENLCSRAIWIDGGQVVEIGETKKIIETYLQKSMQHARIPLADREDRRGEGDIMLNRLDIESEDGQTINHASTGKNLILRLHYITNANKSIPNCRFSITITRKERVYCMLSTELTSKEVLNIEKKGYVEFLIPRLPLTESVYSITVFVEANNVIQDWVMDAYELSVVGGDYYGTGRNCPHRNFYGEYPLIEFSWKHKALPS